MSRAFGHDATVSTPHVASGIIVVGVDGSEHSARALAWSVDEAHRRSAALRLVHGWFTGGVVTDPTGMVVTALEDAGRLLLDDARATALAQDPALVIDTALVPEAPSTALLAQARDADMVVVGARGHGGFAGLLLGSVCDQVVHHAQCPVVVVR